MAQWLTVYRETVRPYLPQVVAGLVGAVAIGAVVSDSSLVGIWQDNPAKPFIANARRDIADLPAGVPLFDGHVPDDVVSGLAGSEGAPSQLFRPLGNLPPQLTVAPRLAILDASGHVESARVGGAHSGPSAVPGPEPQCGWRVGITPVDIPLDHDLDAGSWVVQLDYVSASAAHGTVTAGDTTRVVSFPFGHADVFLAVHGRIDNIRVVLAGAGTICVGAAAAGVPQPLSGPVK